MIKQTYKLFAFLAITIPMVAITAPSVQEKEEAENIFMDKYKHCIQKAGYEFGY